MSPTGNEQPQESPQGIPRDGEFIETHAVERPAEGAVETAGLGEQATTESTLNAASSQTAPSENLDQSDISDLKVVRPPRPESKKRRMGIRGWIAAAVGGVVLLGGIGANAVSDKNDAEPTNKRDKTDQMQETTTTTEVPISQTADVEVDGVDPNSPVTSINENLSTVTTPDQSSSFQNSEVFEENSDKVQAPIANEQTVVPENYERTVVGPEAYPGEVTVARSFELAKYLISKNDVNDLAPTINMPDPENDKGIGSYFYSHPSGFSVEIKGPIVEGKLTKQLEVILYDNELNNVSVIGDSDGDGNPEVYVTDSSLDYIVTTKNGDFGNVHSDKVFASSRGAELSAKIDAMMRTPTE